MLGNRQCHDDRRCSSQIWIAASTSAFATAVGESFASSNRGPLTGVNGNGMHTNLSISKDGKNSFYGDAAEGLSDGAWEFVVFYQDVYVNEICPIGMLVMAIAYVTTLFTRVRLHGLLAAPEVSLEERRQRVDRLPQEALLRRDAVVA